MHALYATVDTSFVFDECMHVFILCSPMVVIYYMFIHVHVYTYVQVLYSHIVSDIKRINAKHKNNKVNMVLFSKVQCIIYICICNVVYIEFIGSGRND